MNYRPFVMMIKMCSYLPFFLLNDRILEFFKLSIVIVWLRCNFYAQILSEIWRVSAKTEYDGLSECSINIRFESYVDLVNHFRTFREQGVSHKRWIRMSPFLISKKCILTYNYHSIFFLWFYSTNS